MKISKAQASSATSVATLACTTPDLWSHPVFAAPGC